MNTLIVPGSGQISFSQFAVGYSELPPLSSSARIAYTQGGGLTIVSTASSLDRFSVEGLYGNLLTVNDTATGVLFKLSDMSGFSKFSIDDGGNTSTTGVLSSRNAVFASGGNSNQWNSNYTTTKDNSANWSAAYTNLVNNSANYLSGASISYVNTNFVKLSGDTMTGTLSTVSLSAGNIYSPGIIDGKYFSLSGNILDFGVYANEIHVSTDGNDTTGNGDVLRPFKTITRALTIVTAQRRKIIVHSGGYTETPTITQSYTTITSEQQKGDDVVITGTMTTNVGCTIAGLKMDNLNIAAPIGTGAVNILGCDITGTLTKSSNTSYTLIRFCDIGTVNITGAGLVAMLGGNPNNITINNIAAQVVVKSTTTVAPVLSAGNANFVESIVIAAGATSNAIRTAAGTIVTLANSQFIVPLFNDVAKVSLSGFYSIFNCVYDKPKSILVTPSGTGGSTNSIDYFQYIDADKVITPNGNSDNWNAAYTNLVNNSANYLSGASTSYVNANFVKLSGDTMTGTLSTPKIMLTTGGSSSSPAIILSGTNFNSGIYLTGDGDGISINTRNNYTNLSITSQGVFSDRVIGTTADGSAAFPSVYVGYETNSGLFRPAANNIAISIAGTERIRVNSSGLTVTGNISANDTITASGGNSTQWNTAYTNLVNNSAAYLSGFDAFDLTAIATTSGLWNSNYTTTNANSASWSQAYSSFSVNSGFYDAAVNELFSYVITESGDEFITEDSLLLASSNIDAYPLWNSTAETMMSLSAGWQNTANIVASNASSWTSTYTTTNLNSATWNNWSIVSGNYALGSQYVKLSGDTMTGTLSTPNVVIRSAAANALLINTTTAPGQQSACHIVVQPINGTINISPAINLRGSGGSGEIYDGYISSANGIINVGGSGVSTIFRVTNGNSGPNTGSAQFTVNTLATVNVDISNSNAAATVLRVTGSTAQTGNLTEWRNVTPATLAYITPTGNIVTTGTLSANQGIVCAPSTFIAADTVTDAALIMDFTRGAASGGMYVRRSNGQQRSIFNYTDSTGNIDVGTFSNNINSVSIKAGGSGLTGFINFGTHSTNNVMRIIDSGNIGIGIITPNEKLTVVGNMSASGVIYASGGNSNAWNSNYTSTRDNSANWSQAYTNLVSNSANYLSGASVSYVNTNFVKLSGDTMTGSLSTMGLSADNIYSIGIIRGTGGLTIAGVISGNNATTSFGAGFATGTYSFATGYNTTALGNYSTALGINNTGSGYASTVQGAGNVASGNYSHAQGENNIASGESSYAGGQGTLASGLRSTAIGQFTSATKTNAYASGKLAFANHNRSWVWQGTNSDGITAQFVSTRTDQFAARPTNGFFLSGAVGIGTDNNTNALTVVGTISTNAHGTSQTWSQAYTNLVNNSAAYLSGADLSSIAAASASWNSTYTSVKDTSANWDSTYTSVKDTSANWDSTYTSVKDTSANWDSTYTSVKDTSANWNAAYAYTSTYPLLTAMKVSGVNLGSTAFVNALTVPAGRIFIATGLTVVFDNGAFTNLVAGSIRLTKNSVINTANRIIADLNIGILTFASNSLLRRSSINDNNATGQPGEVIQIAMNGATTAYTATVIIEGVLY